MPVNRLNENFHSAGDYARSDSGGSQDSKARYRLSRFVIPSAFPEGPFRGCDSLRSGTRMRGLVTAIGTCFENEDSTQSLSLFDE